MTERSLDELCDYVMAYNLEDKITEYITYDVIMKSVDVRISDRIRWFYENVKHKFGESNTDDGRLIIHFTDKNEAVEFKLRFG